LAPPGSDMAREHNTTKQCRTIQTLRQCIPPPRHVCRGCLSWAGDVMTSQLLWRCLLVHALHRSVAQRSRLIPVSVSPNSDESGKQSPYPDGDPDRHQNLIVCSPAHCEPSLKISCKSARKLLRKVANKQTDKQRRLAATLCGLRPRVQSASPKPPKNTSFLGVTQPPGVAQPLYSRGHN